MSGIDLDGLAAGALLLLDTAPIIYRIESHPTLRARFDPVFKAHAEGRVRFVTATLTIVEVMTGPLKRGDELMAQRYRTMLEDWGVAPLDSNVAERAARLRAQLGLKTPDAVIVASALTIGADAIVTHDRDLERVKGLRVIS